MLHTRPSQPGSMPQLPADEIFEAMVLQKRYRHVQDVLTLLPKIERDLGFRPNSLDFGSGIECDGVGMPRVACCHVLFFLVAMFSSQHFAWRVARIAWRVAHAGRTMYPDDAAGVFFFSERRDT